MASLLSCCCCATISNMCDRSVPCDCRPVPVLTQTAAVPMTVHIQTLLSHLNFKDPPVEVVSVWESPLQSLVWSLLQKIWWFETSRQSLKSFQVFQKSWGLLFESQWERLSPRCCCPPSAVWCSCLQPVLPLRGVSTWRPWSISLQCSS